MKMRTLFSICAAGICLLRLSSASAQMSDGSPELLTKNPVDIGGGRHMNIVCIGQGSPTVVFDYGLGSHFLHWQRIQKPVSALTKACFYDRAGYGYSDPSPRPMTGNNVTDDLHTLLGKAGIAGPVVLVGHSAGGGFATLYADKFGSQVAGLVLIDPAFAGMYEGRWMLMSAEEKRRDQERFQSSIGSLQTCASLARDGKLSEANPHDCFALAPGRTPMEIAYLMDQFLKPFRYESVISEFENGRPTSASLSEDTREEQEAARSFGDMPVIVLTAGNIDAGSPDDTDTEKKAWIEQWKLGHDKLAARSTRGESILVPDTGHNIQLERPQAVIDAIRKVVFTVRALESKRVVP
jgi:pimeloyl-ACP methyl ester carboxylesterase